MSEAPNIDPNKFAEERDEDISDRPLPGEMTPEQMDGATEEDDGLPETI